MDVAKLLDLKGKVAIVTGGGNGIGRGSAIYLAAAGADVALADMDVKAAEAVADEIRAMGRKAVAVECNVAEDTDLVRLVDMAVAELGAVHILVNNVGVGGGGRENPLTIDLAYVERIFRINLFSAWRLCQLVVPIMKREGYGSIVNITSMGSINRSPNMSIYASSKAALNHLAANLAFDFGPEVRINNVGPGAVRTRALATVLTADIEQRMLLHTPINRLGEVDDIAGAVLYFAAPISAWVSGQTLFVNGGGIQTLD